MCVYSDYYAQMGHTLPLVREGWGIRHKKDPEWEPCGKPCNPIMPYVLFC